MEEFFDIGQLGNYILDSKLTEVQILSLVGVKPARGIDGAPRWKKCEVEAAVAAVTETVSSDDFKQPDGAYVRTFRDLGFTVRAEVKEYLVEFKIYDIEGWVEDKTKGVYDKPLWHERDAPTHPAFIETLECAEVYAHGDVKWDGCSNWHFDEQDRVMLHGCTRGKIQRFGDILGTCWDWTKELCPDWAEDMG